MSFCSPVGAGRRQRRSKSRRVWQSAPRREGEASATKRGRPTAGRRPTHPIFQRRKKPETRRGARRRKGARDGGGRENHPTRRAIPEKKSPADGLTAARRRPAGQDARSQKAGFAQRGQHARKNVSAQDVRRTERARRETAPPGRGQTGGRRETCIWPRSKQGGNHLRRQVGWLPDTAATHRPRRASANEQQKRPTRARRQPLRRLQRAREAVHPRHDGGKGIRQVAARQHASAPEARIASVPGRTAGGHPPACAAKR